MGALSALIVASLLAYVVAPSGEAIAAKAVDRPAAAGKEAIKGRVTHNGKAARGTEIRILKRTPHGLEALTVLKVGPRGRFALSVRPGAYIVIIKRPDASKRVSLKVRRRHSVFLDVTVKTGPGGVVIAPVIFNY